MFDSGAGPDSYNKTTRNGKGTLVQNWYEEAILRDDMGEGRSLAQGHLPKNRQELFLRPPAELGHVYEKNKKDDTFGRILGRLGEPQYKSENQQAFSKHNEPKPQRGVGKRYELLEKQFLESINSDISQKNQQQDQVHEQRNFGTMYGQSFAKKDVNCNAIGRRVMRDQDGHAVPPSQRDEDLLVNNGFLKTNPLANEQDINNAVPKETYVQSQPITFWSEKVNQGVFYGSKKNDDKQAFNKNNDFLKSFTHYKHKN